LHRIVLVIRYQKNFQTTCCSIWAAHNPSGFVEAIWVQCSRGSERRSAKRRAVQWTDRGGNGRRPM
jgi:hypothetical protein